MRPTGSGFVLSTGRAFYAYDERLTPWSGAGAPGSLSYGYDGRVDEFDDAPLTDAERREIADYVVARWEAWARGEVMPDGE